MRALAPACSPGNAHDDTGKCSPWPWPDTRGIELLPIRTDIFTLGAPGIHPEAGGSVLDRAEPHVKRATIDGTAGVVAVRYLSPIDPFTMADRICSCYQRSCRCWQRSSVPLPAPPVAQTSSGVGYAVCIVQVQQIAAQSDEERQIAARRSVRLDRHRPQQFRPTQGAILHQRRGLRILPGPLCVRGSPRLQLVGGFPARRRTSGGDKRAAPLGHRQRPTDRGPVLLVGGGASTAWRT